MEDTAYKNDVRNIGNKVLEEILNDLTTLGKDTDVAVSTESISYDCKGSKKASNGCIGFI